MESEHGLSPEQLWVVGMARSHGTITILNPVSALLKITSSLIHAYRIQQHYMVLIGKPLKKPSGRGQ